MRVYDGEMKSEELIYFKRETYGNELEFLMGEKREKDEEEKDIIAQRELMFCSEKYYSDAETNVN